MQVSSAVAAVLPASSSSAGPQPEPATLLADQSILQLQGVSKSFVGTLALDTVDFDLKRGECHVLFGENGAGKSTLIQILAGVHKPTTGTILHDGVPIEVRSVHHSRSLGISAVFQEFSIAPALTVVENLFLGDEPRRWICLDKKAARVKAQQILGSLGFTLDLNRLAGTLSRAEKQMLEIARAFRSPPSVLILDEPTASLTDTEANELFVLIDRLKTQGVGIVYITHRMHEIERVGDRVSVLRDGKLISTLPIAEAKVDRLISLMTGRPKNELFPVIRNAPTELRLTVKNLSMSNGRISNASFEVRSGEVVGIAGLVGSGKGDVGVACLGLHKLKTGTVLLGEFDATGLRPRGMLDRGFCYVPSDRRADGLFLEHDVRANITIASLERPPIRTRGIIWSAQERKAAQSIAGRLAVRPASINAQAARLSGGNQQKVMMGRYLAIDAGIYVFDEPTVGVDVGARHAIYEQIKALCESGAGVLLISSDLSEILNLTHRSYVMHHGRVVGHLAKPEFSQEKFLDLMFGTPLHF
jgi:ribose transport system ATP-binding protein